MSNRDNVTDITSRVSPFPQDSNITFPVAERTDGWRDKHGQWHVDDTCKKLVREMDGKPVVLSTVGSSYKVIQNRELFPYVEQRMMERFDAHLLRGVQVTEDMSYGGRDCYRTYVFPNLRCDIDGGGDVAFRLIIGNSYGAKAISLIAGAIDFFCTNGMIIGMHEKTARKHTKGVTVHGLDTWIGDSVTYFTKHKERMQRWSHTEIPHDKEDPLFEMLVDKSLMSERHASTINNEMHYERNRRSGRDVRPNEWHLYSALTAWASHGDVRDTGNDHAANTRIDRGKHVLRVMQAADRFLEAA